MLRFSCSNCAARLTAREDRAGKVVLCPKCKKRITIPTDPAQQPPQAEPARDVVLVEPAKASNPLSVEPPTSLPPPVDEPAVDPRERDEKLLISLGVTPLSQHTGERRFPWPVDILLYPISQTGLTCIAVLAATPPLFWFIRVFFGRFGLGGITILLCGAAIGIYAGWYLGECVYDSARGGTRAPDASSLKIGQSDIGSRITYIASVYAVYGVPMVVYFVLFRRTDAVFWALAVWVIVFFPMALLAMVMHDSICALNPFFLLGSMFRTFFQYAGLFFLLLGMAAVIAWVITAPSSGPRPPSVWLTTIRAAVSAYIVFLMAHIVGRFYWRNRQRLDWGI